MKWLYSGLFLFLISCNEVDSFYTDYAEEDLYRIPLIKPYRLITLYGTTEDSGPTKSWFLKLYYAGDTTRKGYLAVGEREINVEDGIIYGYEPPFSRDSASYFVIIPSKKIESVFRNKNQWSIFLKQNGIDSPRLYKIWNVWKDFKQNQFLPWLNRSDKMQ